LQQRIILFCVSQIVGRDPKVGCGYILGSSRTACEKQFSFQKMGTYSHFFIKCRYACSHRSAYANPTQVATFRARCLLIHCTLSHTHNIPFTVSQWKRTFDLHHGGGFKNVTDRPGCIDSIYREQDHP